MNAYHPLSKRFSDLRVRLIDRWLDFHPYIRPLPLNDSTLRFFHATAQAAAWYDPLAAHLRAEFEWVRSRLRGRQEVVLDAGAFHGIYAMIMAEVVAEGSRVVVVDPVPSNIAIMQANFALNALEIDIVEAAIGVEDGPLGFTRESCGRISDDASDRRVDGRRLDTVLPDATVVKLDIEGAEFDVLPAQIDSMDQVHTWIVELHPHVGRETDPILALFRDRGFDMHVLDRRSASVEPLDGEWTDRTSLIALRS